jgi:prevent-host-death family protein
MTKLDVQDAAQKLPDLLDRALAGEEIVISRSGKPSVRLVPAQPVPNRADVRGMFREIVMSDSFTAPLSEDELREWEQ